MNTPSFEVIYYVFEPTEPMDAVKHFTFHGHFGRIHGMPLMVTRELLEAGPNTGLHCHDDAYTLTVIRAGRGTVIINDHPYALVRGDVYIIPPGRVHGIRDFQGIELDAFYFQAQLFSRSELAALRKIKGFWKLMMHGGGSKAPDADQRLHLSPEMHQEVDEIITHIRNDLGDAQPLGAVLARHQFFRLLARLAMWHTSRHADEPAKSEPVSTPDMHTDKLADVVQYCEEHFAEQITVPQLAARMFVSPDHFSRLFTASTGMPPAAYLRRLRLERAQALLRTTTLPIAEIATLSGLRDPFQLSHAFRAAFDISPSGYRAKYRK